MADPGVAAWKQRGKCYLWSYRQNERNFPGLHLTADPACCQSLMELSVRLRDARYTGRAQIRLTSPTSEVLAVPNNGERVDSFETLELRFDPTGDDPVRWVVERAHQRVRLELGRTRLEELRAAIEGIPRGEGDFSLGPEDSQSASDTELWFWWLA